MMIIDPPDCNHLQPIDLNGILAYPALWPHTTGVWFDTPTSAGMLILDCATSTDLTPTP